MGVSHGERTGTAWNLSPSLPFRCLRVYTSAVCEFEPPQIADSAVDRVFRSPIQPCFTYSVRPSSINALCHSKSESSARLRTNFIAPRYPWTKATFWGATDVGRS
ncbi:MAG: hypothetical protein BWY79_00139 [Actinobacteria bacterium ADurb.Bin444]|nr:MAG: hypothetical protein BWY79_00139 [Actinobacteria bacterium ADurb.Bin444]